MRRLLILGYGDVGRRLVFCQAGRYRMYALTHSPARQKLLRARAVVPVAGDLDAPDSLERIGGLAHDVVHMGPPPGTGPRDMRMTHLFRALARAWSLPQRLVYLSTSGVYGDCAGERVAETRLPAPAAQRAQRRPDAERQSRAWGKTRGVAVAILRLPRPPRVGPAEADARIPEALLAFVRESRQLANFGLGRELRVRLRYPTVADALRVMVASGPTGDRRGAVSAG
jgi:nucleoside-diphosphate-sugar epimerase